MSHLVTAARRANIALAREAKRRQWLECQAALSDSFGLAVEALVPLRRAWDEHKVNAYNRGHEFLLTFEEWLEIWVDSGHLYERGCRRGQYVMARFGDQGPYDIDNVKIIPNSENMRERNLRVDVGSFVRGKVWITNGRINRRVSSTVPILRGWRRGRCTPPWNKGL